MEGIQEHPVLSLLQIDTYSRPGVKCRAQEWELSAIGTLHNLNLRSNTLQGAITGKELQEPDTQTVSSTVELAPADRELPMEKLCFLCQALKVQGQVLLSPRERS